MPPEQETNPYLQRMYGSDTAFYAGWLRPLMVAYFRQRGFALPAHWCGGVGPNPDAATATAACVHADDSTRARPQQTGMHWRERMRTESGPRGGPVERQARAGGEVGKVPRPPGRCLGCLSGAGVVLALVCVVWLHVLCWTALEEPAQTE